MTEPTHADRAWACDYLSAVLGRPVTGGLHADRLAQKLAAERAHADPPIPEPRTAWRQHPIRGGAQR